MGNFRLPPACLVYTSLQQQESQIIVIQKIVHVYGSTIRLFGERFRDGQYTLVAFLFSPRCSTCPAICKSGGTPPCSVVPDPLSGERPLADGVGSGDPRDGSSSVWSRGKALAGMESGAPRSQLFVKMGARVPVPYGVGATVSDILIVNLAAVIDVFSLYTRLTSRLDLLL